MSTGRFLSSALTSQTGDKSAQAKGGDAPMQTEDVELPLLRSYAKRFMNRWDRVLMGRDGSWRCAKQPLTEGHLRHAVAGQISLGAYAVDSKGMSRWACLDLDDNVRGDRFVGVIEQLDDPSQALLEYSRRG